MDSRVLKVFVAVALGSFIGTVVALQFNPVVWWLGLAVGGLVGYLAYEPMRVVHAVPIASRTAAHGLGIAVPKMFRIFGKVFTALARVVVPTITASVILGLVWGAAIVFPVSLIFSLDRSSLALWHYVLIGLGWAFFVFGASGPEGPYPSRGPYSVFRGDLESEKESLKALVLGTPPILIVALAIAILRRVPKAARGFARFLSVSSRFIARFIFALFHLIHSDIRLLCGVDAAIGAAIGYFTQNALIGALVGGLFGALNFEILSKRALKVVPLRTRS